MAAYRRTGLYRPYTERSDLVDRVRTSVGTRWYVGTDAAVDLR